MLVCQSASLPAFLDFTTLEIGMSGAIPGSTMLPMLFHRQPPCCRLTASPALPGSPSQAAGVDNLHAHNIRQVEKS